VLLGLLSFSWGKKGQKPLGDRLIAALLITKEEGLIITI
jgi:hypothetical protein